MTDKVYVLYHREHNRWYHRLAVGGLVWISGIRRSAQEFPSRAAATKVLHTHGKHHDGWKVVVEPR